MSSDRLTRKEIKRDEFAEALESSVHWLEKHRNMLIAAAVAAVVVAVGAFAVWSWWQGRAVAANEALAEALEVYRAPVGDAAAASGDDAGLTFPDGAARRARATELFTALRDEHGGSEPAAVAGVYLAQIAVEEGDFGRARDLWQGFLDHRDDHVLASQVRVNLIHLDRQEGRGEELVGELESELAASPEERTLPADLVLWELAQTYEALNRDDEARSHYRRLAEEYPTSPYASEAQRKAPPEGGPGQPPVQLGGGLTPGR